MITAFLDWFDRHKFGIIGTLLVHTLVVFTLLVARMRTVPREDQRSDMRIEVIDDEEAEEIIQRMEAEPGYADMPVTNVGSNITAQVAPREWSQQRLSERVENDLRDFERAEFERLAEERRERGEEDITIPELDPSKWDKDLYLDKAVQPVKVEGSTTWWHNLEDRADRSIRVPAYLCRGVGQVVVRVQVDREGVVREATVDPQLTTTPDACMRESAERAAWSARFFPSANAPDRQKGAIYFRFMPQ